jgi:molybdate transport system substrate-binding protein
MKFNLKFFLAFFLTVVLIACTQTINSNPKVTQSISPNVTLNVSAASDLKYALEEIGKTFEKESGNKIVFNFGSTGQLARQIENGAPVDIFAAANRAFIEELDKKGLIITDTKQIYGIGRITLWTREDAKIKIQDIQDVMKPEVRKIAIANPDHAPYGLAAKEALQSVGLWEKVKPKLVLAQNIRQAQQYGETGNVDVTISALSLSINKPGNWVLIPEDLHKPLEQMLAVIKDSKHELQSRNFANFITSSQSRNIMKKYGFILPGETPIK